MKSRRVCRVRDRNRAESNLGVTGMVELEPELALKSRVRARVLVVKTVLSGTNRQLRKGVCTSSVSFGSSSIVSIASSKFGFLSADGEEEQDMESTCSTASDSIDDPRRQLRPVQLCDDMHRQAVRNISHLKLLKTQSEAPIFFCSAHANRCICLPLPGSGF